MRTYYAFISKFVFMTLITDLDRFIKDGHLYFIPQLSIDCTIIGYHNKQLKILLISWDEIDGWSLPGGNILQTESIDAAAHRILQNRTGLSGVFLKQYQTFGEMNRILPGDQYEKLTHSTFYNKIKGSWLDKRTVSIGYYALIDFSQASPRPDEFSRECKWFDIEDFPDLLFDHNEMISAALKTIQNQLHYQPIGINLLPDEFTLPELQYIYETLLNRKFDRRNFQKKMENLEILTKLDKRKNIGSHRSPFLYRFNEEKYKQALSEGKGIVL